MQFSPFSFDYKIMRSATTGSSSYTKIQNNINKIPNATDKSDTKIF